MNKAYYSISDYVTPDPTKIHVPMHGHDEHEILLFLEGDARYIVEGNTYPLEPGDIMVIRKHEMHCIEHNSATLYRRYIMMLSPDFFTQHNCTEYESHFLHVPAGKNNKLAAEMVHSSGLYDAFFKYKKYSEEYILDRNSPILISTVIEILYLINKISGFSTTDFTNGPMKSVIHYLNNRYMDDLSLDQLAEHFYLSKHYLCRAFRKATGITIHEYICRKRLAKVRQLKVEGYTIGEAAAAAGFKDYSCFYRAYVKEYGSSPRNNLF